MPWTPASSSRAQAGKQVGGRFDEIADGAEVKDLARVRRHLRAEGQERFAARNLARREPQPGRRRIVARQHAGRGRAGSGSPRRRRSGRPRTSASAARVMPPSRSTRPAAAASTSTTVDSVPAASARHRGSCATRLPRSASTCCSRGRADVTRAVGARRRDRPIRGAQQGLTATACAGTLHRDGVETRRWRVRRCRRRAAAASTRVSAPGQNAAANWRRAVAELARAVPPPASGTCTISGLKRGRPLAAKIAATARPLVASAPRP